MIRVIDFFVALLGLLILSPVLTIIAILGYFGTGSPVFTQRRVGKNNQEFTLIKFRTMSVDTASVGTHLVDASAITPLGGFLRKTKLDELPQLINVLAGQMSLVGPRPCLPSQIELIEERVKRNVHLALPGITGLAQINNIDMSTPTKLARVDSLMLKKISFFTYIGLIVRTASGSGAGDKVSSQV